MQQHLSELSLAHHAEESDDKELRQLIGYLQQWEGLLGVAWDRTSYDPLQSRLADRVIKKSMFPIPYSPMRYIQCLGSRGIDVYLRCGKCRNVPGGILQSSKIGKTSKEEKRKYRSRYPDG